LLIELRGVFVQTLSRRDVSNALNMAALKGHVEIVEALLNAGADVTAKDGSGNAPVHSAVIEYVC
jgi:ankyrin repeat protein